MRSLPGESEFLEAEDTHLPSSMESREHRGDSPALSETSSENADDARGTAHEPNPETREQLSKDRRPPRTNQPMMSGIDGAPNEKKLRDLMQRTGYPIAQTNGQRRFGPPPDWHSDAPPRGCEVFVGKIPRDLFEDELVPVFETVGRIYELRLMMDFSGANRGFAFVVYTKKGDAQRSVRCLNNCEIRKGRFLGVCSSVDNCRLFVGGIPKKVTKEEIIIEMRKITDGVTDVIVYPSVADKTRNRGFAFVEYENHTMAAKARRKLMKSRVQLWGHQIAIDWAEPEQEVDEETMAQVKVLYVRNLMLSTTEETLQKEFGEHAPVERVKKIRDFAFVHYAKREDAIKAMQAMHGSDLEGSQLEVTLAKPVDKEQHNFYKSLRNSQRMAQIAAIQAANNGYYSPIQASGGMVSSGLPPQQGYSNFYESPRPFMPGQSAVGRGTRPSRGAPGGMTRPSYNGYPIYQAYPGNVQSGSISLSQLQAAVTATTNGVTQPSTSPTLPPHSAHQHYLQPQPASPYYSGSISPSTSPTSFSTSGKSVSSEQLLEEFCAKNNWGKPVFTLQTIADGTNGGNLHFFKVSIPACGFHCQPPAMSRTKEEARTLATDTAVSQLQLSYSVLVDGSPRVEPAYLQQYTVYTTGQSMPTTVVTAPLASTPPSKLSPVPSSWPMSQEAYTPYAAYAGAVNNGSLQAMQYPPSQHLPELYAPYAASTA